MLSLDVVAVDELLKQAQRPRRRLASPRLHAPALVSVATIVTRSPVVEIRSAHVAPDCRFDYSRAPTERRLYPGTGTPTRKEFGPERCRGQCMPELDHCVGGTPSSGEAR